tara:strand:+ start:163 stop:996 length:834 start_codon:yes stop_codon:yes gene_type:complete
LEVKTKKLKKELYNWYKTNKREFSWRNSSNPWKIFLIETLSQQTQLNRANKYYEIFIKLFPTPEDMSKSTYKEVLEQWLGLGYNNRAKRLHEASKIISNIGFDNLYPNFEFLPGVGKYTSSAIRSFAYGDKIITEDTNVKRILSRFFGIDNIDKYLRNYSNLLLSRVESRDINQAFMDFGSQICKSSVPNCTECPVESLCSKYFKVEKKSVEKFKGSNRETRGKILKYLVAENPVTFYKLKKEINTSEEKFKKALSGMKRDNLIKVNKNNVIEINSE